MLEPNLKSKVSGLRAIRHAPCQNGNRLNAVMKKKPEKQSLHRNAGESEKSDQKTPWVRFAISIGVIMEFIVLVGGHSAGA